MNRHHLALFRAVAEEGSITAAARALRISQPAVSAQVAAFERQIGSTLFDRLPRGVRLTATGEILFDYASRIHRLEREAEAAIDDHLHLGRGRLAIGASTSIGSYFLPTILGRLSHRHPGIRLSLGIANTETIQRDLADGVLDLGLTEGFADPELFDVEVFREDELKLIVPRDHEWAAAGRVGLEQLAKQPLLAREPGSGTRAVLEKAFSQAGIELEPVMSLGSSEALKRGVIGGLGVAWVSVLTLGHELAADLLVTVDVDGLEIRRPLHRLLPLDRTVPPSVRALESLLAREPSLP